MAATVQINEYNDVGEVKEANITNSNMGDVDDPNLDPVANPVIPGENTYEKYQTLEVTAMGGSSAIDNLKIWRTGALGGSAVHMTNARIADYAEKSYVQPIKTDSTQADQAMPTSEPASADLGIGGALAGSLIAAGESDLLIHQIQTDAGDVAGSTSTMNFQYDEVS